jgi:hypothetical protein
MVVTTTPHAATYVRKSDGAELQFDTATTAPFRLLHHEGFAVGDFEHIATAAIDGHGDFWLDARAKERISSLDILLQASSLTGLEALRRQLIAILNPLRGSGTLYLVTGSGDVRAFDCVLAESLPLPTASHIGGRRMRTIVRLRSVGLPFLYDAALRSVSVPAPGTGTFILPVTLPATLASSTVGVQMVLSNDGDVPTPVRITVVGPAVTPKLRNLTTGESIEFALTIAPASPLYVDTDPRVPVVTLYGAPAWSYLTRAEFWQLQPGANTIEIAFSGTSATQTTATVAWNERFLGV